MSLAGGAGMGMPEKRWLLESFSALSLPPPLRYGQCRQQQYYLTRCARIGPGTTCDSVIRGPLEEQHRKHGARELTVAVSFYDLGQRKPSSEELVEMAKRFNYEAGAAFLARLNSCLSLAIASKDEKIFADVHERLTASVLSPARRKEVVNAFGDKLYRTAIVLNRAQILAGIKLLAL